MKSEGRIYPSSADLFFCVRLSRRSLVWGYVSLVPMALAPSDGNKNYRGGTWGYVRDKGKKMHGGIDLAMAENTDLYPPYDDGEVVGVVTKFRPNQYGTGSGGALGNYVRIKYNHPKYGTFIMYYAHLNSVNVRVGDRVNRGTIIARSGRTGNLGTEKYGISGKFLGYKEKNRKYKPHVHIQVKRNGRFINPALVLPGYVSKNFDMRTGKPKAFYDIVLRFMGKMQMVIGPATVGFPVQALSGDV